MNPTYVSVLTPPGVAAIAVIGITGPDALALIGYYFRASQVTRTPSSSAELSSAQTTTSCAARRVVFGWFDDGHQRDEIILVIRRNAPFYLVELHCHGGPAVVQWILDCLLRAGAVYSPSEKWTQVSETDPLLSIAWPVLIQAPTLRTAAIVLDQINGAWAKATSTLARACGTEPLLAREIITHLAEQIPVGQHLTRPFRVVLAGAPNTGKSTLLNALVGYSRAITSPQPGTTRDSLTAEIACDGWPIQLIDTAGWRHTLDPLELESIARAQENWGTADLVLWLLDSSADPVFPPYQLPRLLLIVNKADLPEKWHPEEVIPPDYTYLTISAKTGLGIENLVRMISATLVPKPPEPGQAVPFTDVLCDAVSAAFQAIQHDDWQRAKTYVSTLLASCNLAPSLSTLDLKNS